MGPDESIDLSKIAGPWKYLLYFLCIGKHLQFFGLCPIFSNSEEKLAIEGMAFVKLWSVEQNLNFLRGLGSSNVLKIIETSHGMHLRI